MNERKKKRLLRKNKKIKRREGMEIEITSLLDILVILLVFLLQSYNASNLSLDLVENIEPPGSKARDLGEDAIIVQVNRLNEVWVNHDKLKNKITHNKVKEELKEKLNEIRSNQDSENEKQKMINLVFDKKVPYSNMQKIMNVATVKGYTNFKFIVMADYTLAKK